MTTATKAAAGVLPARRRWTAAEYHQMGDAGIIGPEERTELLDGEILLMAPIGSRHAGTVIALDRILQRAAGAFDVLAIDIQMLGRAQATADRRETGFEGRVDLVHVAADRGIRDLRLLHGRLRAHAMFLF